MGYGSNHQEQVTDHCPLCLARFQELHHPTAICSACAQHLETLQIDERWKIGLQISAIAEQRRLQRAMSRVATEMEELIQVSKEYSPHRFN